MVSNPQIIGKVNHGVQMPVISADVAQATDFDVAFDVQSDSVLVTLFVEASAGDVSCEVFAITQGGQAWYASSDVDGADLRILEGNN